MLDSIVLDATTVEATGTSFGVEAAARVFAALADPARLQVLAVLGDAGRCVCEIQDAVPIATNLLSYHLRILREAGLIEGTRRGRWIDYRLAPIAAARVAAALAAAGLSATIDHPAGCAADCEVPR